MTQEKNVKNKKSGLDVLVPARAQHARDLARKEVEPYAAVIAYEMQERGVRKSVDIQKAVDELLRLDQAYREVCEKWKTDKYPEDFGYGSSAKFSSGVTQIIKNGEFISITKKVNKGGENVEVPAQYPISFLKRVITDFIYNRAGIWTSGARIEAAREAAKEIARIESILKQRAEVLQILKDFDVHMEEGFVDRGNELVEKYKEVHSKWKVGEDVNKAGHEARVVEQLGEARWARLQLLNQEVVAKGEKPLKKLPKLLDDHIEESVRMKNPYTKTEGEPEKPSYDARGRAKAASFTKNTPNLSAENFDLWERAKEARGGGEK